MEIVEVQTAWQLAAVRDLFDEYWRSFHFSPCFQNFAAEVAALPGAYARPHGRLALAIEGDRPAACGAFRQFDASRCEAKRLYVKPEFRGRGIARTVIEWLIGEAKSAGYTEMLGDSIPVMTQALALYEQLGFVRTGPYASDPTPGAIYLRLKLIN